jgi:hypothetical protein
VFRTHGRAVQLEEAATFEHTVDDRLSEVVVVQDATPGGRVLVAGEDHRPAQAMPVVDHVVEHVGRVGAVGQVAHFVDDEDVRTDVLGECVGEATGAEGPGELVDELCSGDEASVEAVLDGTVGDGDGQVRLAAPGRPVKDEVSSIGHEVGRQGRAEQRQLHRGLEGEVEVVDGFQERKTGTAREPLDARLLALSDLLSDEDG